MSTRLFCDFHDREIIPGHPYISILVPDELLATDTDEEVSEYQFCSWSCLAMLSIEMHNKTAQSGDQILRLTRDHLISEQKITDGEDVEIKTISEERPRKVKVSSAKKLTPQDSKNHGPIQMGNLPLEEREERNDNVEFGGVKRKR